MSTIGHTYLSALMAGKEARGPGGPRATLSFSLTSWVSVTDVGLKGFQYEEPLYNTNIASDPPQTSSYV